MPVISPTKTSHIDISLPHWQSVWIRNHKSINFSGLIQEMVNEVIKTHDLKYFEKNKQYIGLSPTKKKEIINQIVSTTPIITNT